MTLRLPKGGYTHTSHGWPIDGIAGQVEVSEHREPARARCGGIGLCKLCTREARVMRAGLDEPTPAPPMNLQAAWEAVLEFARCHARTSGDSPGCDCVPCAAVRAVAVIDGQPDPVRR